MSASKLNIVYPSIREYFTNKTVFITGGTGFIGKVLVEKLLYSCPEISKIYVLTRPSKKETDINERIHKMFSLPVFNRIRHKPELLSKVVAIKGDINLPDIVINETDREKLIKDANVVIHNAATLNFNEDLDLAVKMNLIAVKDMVNLCKKFENLQAMVHVSTAYSNCVRKVIKEKVYTPDVSPEKVMELYNILGPKLTTMTDTLLNGHPNTYTFTKGLAEKYIEENKGDLPVTIVRPSIVTAAHQEPMPGWIDSWMGPTGIISGIAHGYFRLLVGESDIHCLDMIPVDMVSNAIIAAAWHKGVTSDKELDLFTVSNGMKNPINLRELMEGSAEISRKNPVSGAIFYPKVSFITNKIHFWSVYLFHHIIPAAILDQMRRITGKEPILMKLQKRIWTLYWAVQPFSVKTWTFDMTNAYRLQSLMNENDKKGFLFDSTEINWNKYLQDYTDGIRRYLSKEDDKTLHKARENMERLYKNYIVTKVTFGLSGVVLFLMLLKKSCTKGAIDKQKTASA